MSEPIIKKAKIFRIIAIVTVLGVFKARSNTKRKSLNNNHNHEDNSAIRFYRFYHFTTLYIEKISLIMPIAT